MRLGGKLATLGAGITAGLAAATEYTGWLFRWPREFGPYLAFGSDFHLYAPWAYLDWHRRFGALYPQAWSGGVALLILGIALGVGLIRLFPSDAPTVRHDRGWGDLEEAKKAGLLGESGCVLGEFRGKLLTTEDMRPTLVTGGTRSGKGRGHIVPSLLAWTASALVHDPKSELWTLTAGWRAGFSHVLYFNPRDPSSACFNPLAEINPGPQEVAEVQRLVAILADPGGVRDDEAIWDKAASEILEAVILHVLYTAELKKKSLPEVVRLLADLDATAKTMIKTLHIKGPDGQPQTHPFIDQAVRGYAAMHDRFRTSVQGTARSYLKWLAGVDIERALCGSDFRLGDLMCAKSPVTLYVQISPADQKALKPLVRLLFYAAAQTLTAHEHKDSTGREKKHRLLMVMDEFPLLGRLDFFEKSLRLMSGYGIKAMFAAQSLNDIVETYGVHNTILDNCFVYTAFSALDPLTQDKVSKLTGSVDEPRRTVSGPLGWSGGRSSESRSTTDRPLLEPGEIRSLGQNHQLTFVDGHKPLRSRKVRYDEREPFRSRMAAPPPDQAKMMDAPPRPKHPWTEVTTFGTDESKQPDLFKEQRGAVADKDAAARLDERQKDTDRTVQFMRDEDAKSALPKRQARPSAGLGDARMRGGAGAARRAAPIKPKRRPK